MNDEEFARLIDEKIASQAKEAAAEGGDIIVAAMTVKSEIEHRYGVTMSGSAFASLFDDFNFLMLKGQQAVLDSLPIDKSLDLPKREKIAQALNKLLRDNRQQMIGITAGIILRLADQAMKEAERNSARKLAKQK